MKAVLIAICVLATASLGQAQQTPENRKLLQSSSSCLHPSDTKLYVPGSYQLMSVVSSGLITFYCNNGVTSLNHAEANSMLRSDDGVWVGTFSYPVSGPTLGMPTYNMTNTVTGEKRIIWGDNKPQVRVPSPDGSDITWSRRLMWGDNDTLDVVNPDGSVSYNGRQRANYVIRNETWDTGKPTTDQCSGNQDIQVPYTARHTFFSCDAPRSAPLAHLYPSTAPVPAPIPAATPRPALAPLAPIPSPMPAPTPAPMPAPVPAPVLAPPPVANVTPAAAPVAPLVTAPPPPHSAAVTTTTTIAAVAVIALAAAWV